VQSSMTAGLKERTVSPSFSTTEGHGKEEKKVDGDLHLFPLAADRRKKKKGGGRTSPPSTSTRKKRERGERETAVPLLSSRAPLPYRRGKEENLQGRERLPLISCLHTVG